LQNSIQGLLAIYGMMILATLRSLHHFHKGLVRSI
jgi:hypothetical protein